MRSNRYKLLEKIAQKISLKHRLLALRPQIVQAAQEILDAWTQDEEGVDQELQSGGACDAIANAMYSIINFDDIFIIDGGHDGDDHAYVIVYNDDEAYEVDIPSDIYERGGGYSWRKIPDVQLKLNDVVITKIDRSWIQNE